MTGAEVEDEAQDEKYWEPGSNWSVSLIQYHKRTRQRTTSS